MYLTIAKEIADKNGEKTTCDILDTCYTVLDQHAFAIKYLDLSFRLAKDIGDKQGEEIAIGNTRTYFRYFGHHTKAAKCLLMRLTLAKEIGNRQTKGTAYGNLGRCRILSGLYNEAERNFRKAVKCCEELFQNAPMMDEYKVYVVNISKYIYQDLIRLLLAQKKKGSALVVAERGRSRALANLIFNTGFTRFVNHTAANISDLYEIHKTVEDLGRTVLFFALVDLVVCTWIIQPNGQVLLKKLVTERSQQARALFPSHFDLNTCINKIVELMVSCVAVRCEDRSLSFLYGEEESKINAQPLPTYGVRSGHWTQLPQAEISRSRFPQPLTKKEVAMVTPSVDQDETEVSMNHGKSDEPILGCLLRDLHQILLEPVRQYVFGSQVIVIPDRSLALVPFAALLDGNENYVSESLHVRLIPSLTTAKMMRERPEQPRSKGPLIIGDPDVGEVVMDGKVIPVPKLPYARTEVEMVGQLLSVDQLIGDRATKTGFLRRVENASLIHIAAHGHAERGEILLAPRPGTGGRNAVVDVMLTITDLERKRIKAKLVVLSCCHSGRGKVGAEGVVGIARAFLGAGARAVLATLWAVDDGATLCFMYHFYQHLIDGESACEALNRSMKAIREMENFRHPRFWAPFVLLGDDVTLFNKKSGILQFSIEDPLQMPTAN